MYVVPKWTNRRNFVASATVTAVFFSPLLLLFFSDSSSLSPRKSESLSRTHAVHGKDCHNLTRASCFITKKRPGHETDLYLARSGWRAQIHRELSYWENITSDQLLSFEKSLNENEFSGLRVVIINNQVRYKVFYGPDPSALQYTWATLFAFKKLLEFANKRLWKLPSEGVIFHISFGDDCASNRGDNSLPVYGYNNAHGYGSKAVERCSRTVGLPMYDWWWPHQDFLPQSNQRMDLAQQIPWSRKAETLLFRGALNSWDDSRIGVLLASLQYPDLVDAKLTGITPGDCRRVLSYQKLSGGTRPRNDCAELVGDHKSPSEFARFKYWLDVDGYGATFRFKNYLLGDSVVFKVESEYYQHFHNSFQPWVHFVPISKTSILSSIKERVEWARANDEECRRMVLRTKTLAKYILTHEQTSWYQQELLSQISTKLHFVPTSEDTTIICCSDLLKTRSTIWGRAVDEYLCDDVAPCSSTLKGKSLLAKVSN